MKIYTEEQLREAFTNGHMTAMNYDGGSNDHLNIFINSIKAIEIPNDDDIKMMMFKYNINDFGQMSAFQVGAKWVIDKIKNQQQWKSH